MPGVYMAGLFQQAAYKGGLMASSEEVCFLALSSPVLTQSHIYK